MLDFKTLATLPPWMAACVLTGAAVAYLCKLFGDAIVGYLKALTVAKTAEGAARVKEAEVHAATLDAHSKVFAELQLQTAALADTRKSIEDLTGVVRVGICSLPPDQRPVDCPAAAKAKEIRA